MKFEGAAGEQGWVLPKLLFQPNDNTDPTCHVASRAYTLAHGQQMVHANRGYRERTAQFADSKALTHS